MAWLRRHSRAPHRLAVSLWASSSAIIIIGCLFAPSVSSLPLQHQPSTFGADFERTHRETVVAVKSKASHADFQLWFEKTSSYDRSHRHLALPEVCDLFGPDADAVHAVHVWAAEHGGHVETQTTCSDFLVVSFPAKNLAQAFQGADGLECNEEGCNMPTAVPPTISHAVDFVDGLGKASYATNKRTSFGHAKGLSKHRDFNPSSRRRVATAEQKENAQEALAKAKGPWYPKCLAESATPPCLKEAYNVSHTSKPSRGSQGVALFGGQFFSPSDLKQFDKKYKLEYTPVHVMNDNHDSEPGNEASLDVQYITGMANGVSTTFMHYACTTEDCKPFLHWILQQANNSAAPTVQSVSVGTTEFEYEEAMGEAYLQRINQEFMKAGMRGFSLLFATGDRASQVYNHKYWINFPSASPYVTAVGGVWLGELGYGPMSVDPDTTGGFANCKAHAQPSYQADAVNAYLGEAARTHAKQPPSFNASFRAVPDVSAMSDAYLIIEHGSETWIGGTSAACPVVAGMVSVLNDARIAAGKGPLGFLNPFLYKHPECFQDITSGSNLYEAVTGWDPASGLGTPLVDCLLAAALTLP